uniref:Secretory carrier membrane protein n=1 Tax=Mesocestoides corti TaxID=53468 RepID=A0A5K3FRU2_MESCO
FQFTSDSGAPFPDPFDELIAARPSATLPAAPPAIAATAHSQPPPLPPPPQQQQQLPQPQPSFASFALPTFPPSTVSQPPPPLSTASASTAWPVLFPPSDTFSSAPPPTNSAFATASPAPVPADKYAALAELDRMGKAEGSHEPPRSNAVPGLASASFASFKPQPLNPFTSPGPNPFQAPTVGAHNPFATAPAAAPTNSFSLFQSNTANGGTAFPTASFNPFIVSANPSNHVGSRSCFQFTAALI